jgi:flagellar motor component MotA
MEATMYIIGIIVFVIMMCIAMLNAGAPIGAFIAPYNFIFVFGLFFIYLLSSNGLKDFVFGIKAGFKKGFTGDVKKVKSALNVYNNLYKCAFIIGAIGFILGLIALLSIFDFNMTNSIGPAIALSLFPFLYSLLFIFIIVMPIKNRLEKLLIK